MWASSQGRVEAVKALLQAGADVNAADADGVTALMWSCGSEAAEEAHQRGLQFLEKATKGQKEVVLLLLQYGARIDDRDNDGITAIMYAAYHGHAGPVEVLLNWGADADVQNKAGQTAHQLAINAGFEEAAGAIERGPTISVSLSSVISCSNMLSCMYV